MGSHTGGKSGNSITILGGWGAAAGGKSSNPKPKKEADPFAKERAEFQRDAQTLLNSPKRQSDILIQIQNRLNEVLRDKLVTLAMKTLDIATPRGLYEHFLIDVEDSGNVKTSRIKEAISAVQLYIYRCLNHLEENVTVDPDLAGLWEWMYSYRDWQANREIFLYPEDYIQPELRENKTDLFAKVENDMKQADLTDPDSVADIFKEYMNGFTRIGNLKIVGSTARDQTVDGIFTKELCMVGITQQQPHHYYYRVATFTYSKQTNQYEPADWGQWQKINIQIQPVLYISNNVEKTGAVTPVFAFGKWGVFWVEQKQTSAKVKTGSNPARQYTATIQYSHLDFRKHWVAAQTLTSIDLKKTPIALQEDSTVFPVYFYSIQTLYIPYQDELYQLTEDILNQDVLVACRFMSDAPPPQNPSLSKHYSNPMFLYYPILNVPTLSESHLDDGELCVARATWLYSSASSFSSDYDNTWIHLATSAGQDYLNGAPIHNMNILPPIPQNVLGAMKSGNIFTQDSDPTSDEAEGGLGETLCYQETLYFKGTPLSAQDIKALYDNSKDYITKDFVSFVPTGSAFNNLNQATINWVLGQPNWNIVDSYKAEYLSIPYKGASSTRLNCYRLNSSAINKLSPLLHQPAGINALLTVSSQKTSETPFADLQPNTTFIPAANDPLDQIDFTNKSAMSNYYWELFFHVPFLIAHELQTLQHFKHAKIWFEYIFNPGINQADWDLEPSEAPNDKFWRFLGLRSGNNSTLAQELSETTSQELLEDWNDPAQRVEYETDPFDPQEIASLRPIAYQKTILTHYIDNLLA